MENWSKENILKGGPPLNPPMEIIFFRIFHGEGSTFVPIQTNDTLAFMVYNSADPQEKNDWNALTNLSLKTTH